MRPHARPLHLTLRPSSQTILPSNHPRQPHHPASYATVQAIRPSHPIPTNPPIQHYPSTQPPSHKPPELRRSQLHRQYTSLLRSTPLLLFFQHNNLLAREWTAIRRELAEALRRAEDANESGESSGSAQMPEKQDPAAGVRLQIIQSGIFAAALRVVSFYDPASASDSSQSPAHALSREAYLSTIHPPKRKSKHALRFARKKTTALHSLLSGPIAVLSFPGVSPDQLATALQILSPTPGAKSAFPAPRRKVAPGYYEQDAQTGLQKLVLLGARVEGQVLDGEGVRVVGGLRGGVEGLRARLVGVLQGVGMGLTAGLEGVGMGLWGTLEGRRMQLEDGGKGREEVTK